MVWQPVWRRASDGALSPACRGLWDVPVGPGGELAPTAEAELGRGTGGVSGLRRVLGAATPPLLFTFFPDYFSRTSPRYWHFNLFSQASN